MVLSKKIIKEAFSEIKDVTPNEALATAFKILEKLNWPDILQGTSSESRKAHNEINGLISQEKFRQKINTQWLAGALLVANDYFKKASENDRQSAVLFFCLSSYLSVNTEYFVQFNNCSSEQRQSIITHINSLLNNVTLSVIVRVDAPDYEVKLKQEYDEGVAEYNIKKTYDFVLAIEHGRGFRSNFIITFLFHSLIRIDLLHFIQRINGMQKPDTIIFYLQELNDEDYARIVTTRQVSNPWVNFEIIRGIIGDFRQKQITEESINAIAQCLDRLYEFSFDFYQQAILFFHNKHLFNQALGRQIINIKNEDALNIFSRVLPIDTYNFNKEARTYLLEEINANASRTLYDEILNICHQRWVTLYESIFHSSKEFLNRLLLTDFCNFIFGVMNRKTDDETIISLNSALDKIFWIDSEWVKSESQQITHFHLYLTEVFLLSEVLRLRSLTSKSIQDRVLLLRKHAYRHERHMNEDLFNQIERNVGVDPDPTKLK